MSEVQVSHLHQIWYAPGRIVNWIDGDTVDVLVEVLPYEWQIKRVRVAKINAPEIGTGEGLAAKVFANGLLPPGSVVRLVADSHENYGRCLASLRFGGNFFGQETEDFGDKMLEAGHAVLYGKNKAVFMP